MRWNHAGIKTANLKKSLDFYCDIFGFRVLEEVEIRGKKYYFVGNDSLSMEIEECNPSDKQADMTVESGLYHICFTVDDLAKTAEEFTVKGVTFALPPSQFRPDRKIAFLRDPDGVVIQLIQYV
jgi:catechol 2,3-dioxygenase-like lactoylglutathione lyase family enzyme